jgi:uncharacterized protein (TIGR04255 family)
MALDDPFAAEPIPELPLSPAPLVRVLAQLRFPAITSLARAEFVAPFQETLRRTYSILRVEQAQSVIIGGAAVALGSAPTWRLHDKSDSWRVSLAQDFVALETIAYDSRRDFFARWKEVLEALQKVADVSTYDRHGVRYINRLTGPDLTDLRKLVRTEVLGVSGTTFTAKLDQSLCETRFRQDATSLNARWGILPANATTDPGIEPVNEPSWILDVDMFISGPREFQVSAAIAEGTQFAERLYAFFRWSVTDELLRRRGGLR